MPGLFFFSFLVIPLPVIAIHSQMRETKPKDTSIRLLKMTILVEKPEPLNTDTRTKD